MNLRMYIALSTSGIVYYASGNRMQPLGSGGVNNNGGCPFAAPSALNLIPAMAISPSGNLYMAGILSGSGAEARTCSTVDTTAPSIFLGGETVMSSTLHNPSGIALSCL